MGNSALKYRNYLKPFLAFVRLMINKDINSVIYKRY